MAMVKTRRGQMPKAQSETRKRLTVEQKAEVLAAFARGESGQSIADQIGCSLPTVYAIKRKAANGGASAVRGGASGDVRLRAGLVNFAVRSLLGQEIDPAERDALAERVQQQLIQQVAAGI